MAKLRFKTIISLEAVDKGLQKPTNSRGTNIRNGMVKLLDHKIDNY